MQASPRIMAGRLANGWENQKGRIVHLTTSPAYCTGPALCGRSPGPRSVGWLDTNKPANCPRCLKLATA